MRKRLISFNFSLKAVKNGKPENRCSIMVVRID